MFLGSSAGCWICLGGGFQPRHRGCCGSKNSPFVGPRVWPTRCSAQQHPSSPILCLSPHAHRDDRRSPSRCRVIPPTGAGLLPAEKLSRLSKPHALESDSALGPDVLRGAPCSVRQLREAASACPPASDGGRRPWAQGGVWPLPVKLLSRSSVAEICKNGSLDCQKFRANVTPARARYGEGPHLPVARDTGTSQQKLGCFLSDSSCVTGTDGSPVRGLSRTSGPSLHPHAPQASYDRVLALGQERPPL